MANDTTNEYRAARLSDLLSQKYGGSKTELGKALGYKSGAFVRQMIEGERPVSEKTVAKVEQLRGCKGWFTRPPQAELPGKDAYLAPDEQIATSPTPVTERVQQYVSDFNFDVQRSAADSAGVLAKFLARLDGLNRNLAVSALEYLLQDPGDIKRLFEVQLQLERLQADALDKKPSSDSKQTGT